MAFWIILWKIVFIVGVGAFAIIAIWVTFAGFKDIKSLFATINKEHIEGTDSPDDDDTPFEKT